MTMHRPSLQDQSLGTLLPVLMTRGFQMPWARPAGAGFPEFSRLSGIGLIGGRRDHTLLVQDPVS